MSVKSSVAQVLWQTFPRLWLSYRIRFRPQQFEQEYWCVKYLCSPDRIAIDVGANAGEYSFQMSKYARQVISFEPNIELWPFLRRLLGADAALQAAALSDRSGISLLRYVPENSGVATIEPQNTLAMITAPDRIRRLTVETRTLDSYGFTDLSMIKIDVEGHEEAVLQGALETIRGNRPSLIIESEDRHNPGAPQRVFAFLRGLDYDGYFIKGGALHSLDKLAAHDWAFSPQAMVTRQYINNFIFIARERQDIVDQVAKGVGP